MGISQNALARAIHVPPRRINEIVLGKRSISADTALRLARYFGVSEKLWLGLQADYDLEEATKVAKNIKTITAMKAFMHDAPPWDGDIKAMIDSGRS